MCCRLYLELERFCAAEPGVVLANADDGSAVLFHTECSVIANNFILRPADTAHIEEVYRLLRSTPDEIRAERPDVKYVLLRARDYMVLLGENVGRTRSGKSRGPATADRPRAAEGFELLKTVLLEANAARRDGRLCAPLQNSSAGDERSNAPPNPAGDTPVSQLTGSAGALR